MGTEILRPYDVLVDRVHEAPASFHRRSNFNRKQIHRSVSNKKKTLVSPDNGATKRARNGSRSETRRKDDVTGGLVMGKVTLLKRGESLASLAFKINGGNKIPDLKPPQPEPDHELAVVTPEKTEPNQIRLSPSSLPDVYAGSAFFSSPSPRSLPLPSFFNKIDPCGADSATQDLRRLLRLD